MIGRVRHLQEDRLFDCYTAAQGGESLDPRAAAHLAQCAECRARYDELVQFMDDLRQEADEETSAVFTPETLRAQQQHIMRRIEHFGHPARVLSFPGRVVRRHFAPTGRIAPRWTAAAAAAGLFIGVLACLMLVAVVRHQTGGMAMQGAAFTARLLILGAGAVYALIVIVLVRRADAANRLLPMAFWILTAVLEPLIPTLNVISLIRYSPINDVEALSRDQLDLLLAILIGMRSIDNDSTKVRRISTAASSTPSICLKMRRLARFVAASIRTPSMT